MTEPVPLPKLTRSRENRLIAGVAAGIAAHVRWSPTVVRVGFVLLLPFSGLGAVLYAVFWGALPWSNADAAAAPKRDARRLIPFFLIGIAVMVISVLASQDGGPAMAVGWLVAVIALGAGIIWHQAEPDRRQPWVTAMVGSGKPLHLLRFLFGAALVALGIIGLAVAYVPVEGLSWPELWLAVTFALVALIGVGLASAPLWWRMLTALRSEREARIRETERAELAAMVHDQVLHTLALIQRNSADPNAVQRLARGQERSLRNWLYQPTGSPTEHFAAALQEAAAEVEDTYGITVETVVVGDRSVDDRVAAIVAAAREALVNAAKHAEVKTISLYAEAEPSGLSVFIRDRGRGFDPETVEETRHGVRGSIIGRMSRHGGQAEIRSTMGEGTEVRLTLPVDGREENQ